jgi:hypothetical protein
MDFLYASAMNHLAAALFLLFGVSVAVRGLGLLFLGIRKPDHPSGPLRVVHGLRAMIVALALVVWAWALLSRKEWLFIIGAIVLTQELYETGILSLILRAERKAQHRKASGPKGPGFPC